MSDPTDLLGVELENEDGIVMEVVDVDTSTGFVDFRYKNANMTSAHGADKSVHARLAKEKVNSGDWEIVEAQEDD